MSDAALPYFLAFVIFVAMIQLPQKYRPVAGLAAAVVLVLDEPAYDPVMGRVAGPCTGLALIIVVAVMIAFFNSAGYKPHD